MRKIISCLMAFLILASALAFSGCSDNTTDAENVLKAYLTSLQGFNVNAMKECVEGKNDDDIGFVVETFSEGYIQTDNYKKSIEDMYKALGHTFSFSIDSNEVIDKETIKFSIKFKYANVDEIAVEEVKPEMQGGGEIGNGVIFEMEAEDVETKMDKYCREQLETYIIRHPSMLDLNEIEYSDKAIGLIASYYKQYLQITSRDEREFTIVVSKKSDNWKIHPEDNKEFFDFLTVIFG